MYADVARIKSSRPPRRERGGGRERDTEGRETERYVDTAIAHPQHVRRERWATRRDERMDYSKFVFEVDEHGRTAMMKAASENNHEAIHQALLKARAHQEGEKPVVQLQAKDGGTALMSAAAHGHTQAIRELMYFDR